MPHFIDKSILISLHERLVIFRDYNGFYKLGDILGRFRVINGNFVSLHS